MGLWFDQLGHGVVAPAISTWLAGNRLALAGLKAEPCVEHSMVGKWGEVSENSFAFYFQNCHRATHLLIN